MEEVLESLASASMFTLTSASPKPHKPTGKKEASGFERELCTMLVLTSATQEEISLKTCVYLKNLSFVRLSHKKCQ